jgi:hypothetical protein
MPAQASGTLHETIATCSCSKQSADDRLLLVGCLMHDLQQAVSVMQFDASEETLLDLFAEWIN